MVAKSFLPNPESKLYVNHLNGIRRDNRVENLEWATPSENIKHAYANNLIDKRLLQGELASNAKLSNKQVETIRQLLKEGHTGTSLAKIYKVRVKHIYDIKSYKSRING